MASPNVISVSQLHRLIGTPDCPRIIDVRIDADFADDPQYIPTAIRYPFSEMAIVAPEYQGQKVVVYCQKGLKISQGAAAILRHYGVVAEVLEGGQFAWRDSGMPLVPHQILPERNPQGSTVWVTKHRPKVDRIACPWLIRRFIDPNAQFLFVAPSQVLLVAEKFAATPFDVEDVFFSHRDEYCTFDTIREEFGLNHPALEHLARIVRGADTNRHDLEPQAAGLLAASLGLSRMYKDDLAQLEAGMSLYDAFYRWCRDAVNEGHDWPATTS